MLKVAIVILNWNGAHYLKKFLPGVLRHSVKEGVRVYVADNASVDHSLELLGHHEFNDAEVIVLDRNYGFAEGYNKALAKIEAKYFMILNSDVEVSANWLDPLVSMLDSDPLIAACSPKIRSFYQRDFFEYAGAAGGYIDKYGYAFCRGRIFNAVETDYGQYDTAREVFWTTGACMLVRADLFKICGGFDADFFAHYEEIDLCWRMKNRGYSLYSVPSSCVYHVGGGTLPREKPFKTYLNYRNSLFTLTKNLAPGIRKKVIFQRLLLDGLSAFRFLTKMQFRHIFAILKAHFSFYRNSKRYRRFRKEEERYIKSFNHEEIYPRSIVRDYYLEKKYSMQTLKWLYHHDVRH